MTARLPTIGPATRAEGLNRLEEFIPKAGRQYATRRNYDYGPADRHNVSVLSPWIRYRLVHESEVVGAVLALHGENAADMFIQEVCWRTYWKGWLEMRPSVWRDYRKQLDALLAQTKDDLRLRRHSQRALRGKTGIECFDFWVRELRETGYLHNHARMWFASIWIFTLKLPWQLGADFFIRHLIDGDPASNTLSWRWVAGLQTPGKFYLADGNNIERFTAGRFRNVSGLAAKARPLALPDPAPIEPLSQGTLPAQEPAALLLSDEDLSLDQPALTQLQVNSIAAVSLQAERSPQGLGHPARRFLEAALGDGLSRAEDRFGAAGDLLPDENIEQALLAWFESTGCRQLVTPYAPVGPGRSLQERLREKLEARGRRLVLLQSPWDRLLWPLATRGYFAFKKKLPPLLAELCPSDASTVLASKAS